MHVDDERLLTLNVISLNKYYSSNHTHCRAAHTTEKWKCSIYTHGQAFMCRLHAYNKTSMILQHKYSTTFHHHVPVNTHVHDVASVCLYCSKQNNISSSILFYHMHRQPQKRVILLLIAINTVISSIYIIPYFYHNIMLFVMHL